MNVLAITGALTSVLKTVVDLAPAAISAERVLEPVAKLIWNHLINKKVVTQEDLNDLDSQIKALSARIQAELPPEQPDDI